MENWLLWASHGGTSQSISLVANNNVQWIVPSEYIISISLLCSIPIHYGMSFPHSALWGPKDWQNLPPANYAIGMTKKKTKNNAKITILA